MMTSDAYLNYGRWVAMCPVPDCGDARALYPEVGADENQRPILSDVPIYEQVCAKGHRFRLVTPDDQTRFLIEQAVADRPEPNRNWLPGGHPWGAIGIPTAQSISELTDETVQHREEMEAKRAADLAQLGELLSSYGVTVSADGTVHGKLPTE